MKKVRLGRSGLMVSKSGFGALPIQRVSMEDSYRILRKAYDSGINFFDSARNYTDSEEKLGSALHDVRENVIIATKNKALTGDDFLRQLDMSLKALKTDYIDLYQVHNIPFCPKPGDGSGLWEAMTKKRDEGVIRHIGFTNHRYPVAEEAVRSGLYETLQFPFSYLATDEEKTLVELCHEHDVGFICMKAMAGGLITRADAAYAFISQYPVVPIWGIQRESELDQFIALEKDPPELNEERRAFIERERRELSGEFCRGCEYCMPCPAGITIRDCARMSLMLRRSKAVRFLDEKGQAMMRRIEDCIDCGQCKSRCPYGLDVPNLLRKNYADYQTFL